MGTRVLYEIMTTVDGKPVPAAILYSNSSHPEEDPVTRFETIVDNSSDRTAVLESMLSTRYARYGGNHAMNDRLYHVVDEPYGDYEFIMRLNVDGEVERIEAPAAPVRVPAMVIYERTPSDENPAFDFDEVSETMGHHNLSDAMWERLTHRMQAEMIDAVCG